MRYERHRADGSSTVFELEASVVRLVVRLVYTLPFVLIAYLLDVPRLFPG